MSSPPTSDSSISDLQPESISTSTGSTSNPSLRQRHPSSSTTSDPPSQQPTHPSPSTPLKKWLLLSLLSGTFAALNGVFAKLTTTTHTSSLTQILANTLSSWTEVTATHYRILDIVIRAAFFGLNLVSNGIMWALFTRALTAGSSATQVSVLNASANFLVTAVLGWSVFGERLGVLWFVGAGCLVLGNVIIGRDKVGEGGSEGGGKEGGRSE